MTSFTGTATRLIHADIENVWNVAITMTWLGMGWGDVHLTGAAALGSTFTLVDESTNVTAQWTTFDPPNQIAWQGDDGSSGRLSLRSSDAGQTLADYTSTNVPHAFVDRLFAGIYAKFFATNAQAEADKHTGRELQSLAYHCEKSK